MDLLDISHHNPITSWDDVPDIPIVHKVNEGTAIDRRVRERLPIIAARHELFGGYTVLIVSRSSIRKQIETYASIMEPFWRDGAITQLDIEPWEGYSRPVSTDEIMEAGAVHDELFGPGRYLAYINPNQLPRQYDELHRSGWLDDKLWLPNYSRTGPDQARARGAVVHQYTSRASVPGFQSGIDANKVYKPDVLRSVARLDTVEPPEVFDPPTEAIDMTVKTLWSHKGDPSVYCLEDGVEISGAVRRAWKDDPNVHVVEVYDDEHDDLRASIKHRAGQGPKQDAPTVTVDLPDIVVGWEKP